MTAPDRSDQPDSPLSGVPIHVVLVPGFWLGAWAWERVEPGLRAAGLVPHAVTLPGLDGSPTEGLTLDDHVAAVEALIDQLDGSIVLVGHSGGALVIQGVADRRPERLTRTIYLDSGPLVDGVSLRPELDGDLPLPSWEQLAAEGASTEGMDEEVLAAFRHGAVDHPGGVASSAVRLRDERRLDVPASVICTSISAAELPGMIEAGHLPSELLDLTDVRWVDLPTGHWPMFSRPAELAEAITTEALVPAG
ncbi:MAG: alpha/beta hydrolase [Actinomycetota bacterium]